MSSASPRLSKAASNWPTLASSSSNTSPYGSVTASDRRTPAEAARGMCGIVYAKYRKNGASPLRCKNWIARCVYRRVSSAMSAGDSSRPVPVEELEPRPLEAFQPHHVVAVQHTPQELVESVTLRAVSRTAAEMPLADAGRAVAGLLEMLGDRGLGRRQALDLLGDEHSRHARSQRMAARQQRRARRGARSARGCRTRSAGRLSAAIRSSAGVRTCVPPYDPRSP